MASIFTATGNHRYRPNHGNFGSIWLGYDQQGQETGITTERHALTIAGSGGGKGAALLIPNALRWTDNLLCIDAKGSIAEATWEAREAMGQRVGVIDPFRAANVPDRLRVAVNLLDAIDVTSPHAREDIRAIADGSVIRYKADDATWDNGAVSVLSGMIAYVLDDEAPEGRTLPAVRELLAMHPDTRQEIFEEMAATTRTDALGKMMKAAAAIGLSTTKKNQEFVGGAVDHTEWLDSDAMASVLQSSDFRLSDLKTESVTLFLVLPPKYIADHSRFLRLFVRCALNAAMSSLRGRRTLFMLDECFSLGHIDQIAKAAGLMREYNVHLWTIWQDLGQIITLYGAEGAHTFFGNADAHMFFNLTDGPSLDYVSGRIGKVTLEETGIKPIAAPADKYDWLNGKPEVQANTTARAAYETAMNAYSHAAKTVGSPRLSPDQVRELIGKKDGDKVARSMIVFGKGGDVFNLPLTPYFIKRAEPLPPPTGAALLRLSEQEAQALGGRIYFDWYWAQPAAARVDFVQAWRETFNDLAKWSILAPLALPFVYWKNRKVALMRHAERLEREAAATA